ncbi:MAG: cyclic nucleotide-binding domain-containing protein, partial [Oligoflexales bacterium]|nr:cyclic nucleotide-binding domain-containing protein [Oligoflexales bacterium]
GDIIIEYNTEPRGIYFIISGVIEYFRKESGIERRVDRVVAPTSFGEFWLMIDSPTKVKIIAEEPCIVYLVSRESFNDLLDKNGAIARKLYKRFTERLINRFLISENKNKKSKVS